MNKNTETNVITSLEDEYPELDRRHKGYMLIGFDDKARTRRRWLYPNGQVPIYRYVGWDKGKKYTGEKLRELRKKNGVSKNV